MLCNFLQCLGGKHDIIFLRQHNFMLVTIQLKEYVSCLWLLRQKLKAATI
jgi:hypothetical protein